VIRGAGRCRRRQARAFAALVDLTWRALLAWLEGGARRRKPSSNLEQQLLQDRLFEIIEAD
jgi:hypothetical protein